MTGVHIEDLDLLERLGGSRATVHRAVVRTTGRVVVVKQAGWDRPDAVAGLAREAHVLGRVQHASLVRLLEVIEDREGRTLVLAHAPGGSLADRVERHGALPAREVADLGARLAAALGALHRAGVVHRDVHPGNVLVDAELQPLLADLDHALDSCGEALPVDAEVVGHPDHVDPRLFRGHPADAASDLHGLATTLWTLATGSPPARPGPRDPVELAVDGRVPPALHEVLAACLDGSVGDARSAADSLRATAGHLLVAAAGNTRFAPVAVASPSRDTPPAPPPHPHPAPPAATPDAPPADPGLADLPPPVCPLPATDSQHHGRGLAAVAGSGGAGRGVTTRRWGPAPRPPVVAAAEAARRSGWLLAAALVLLLPVLAVSWWWATRAGTHSDVVAVVAPPACAGLDPTPQDVRADLDGDGCSELLRLDEGRLTTAAGTFRLGAQGDVLLVGDWDGDGTWTPGLYRPATGEAFLFDDAPGPVAITSRPVVQLDAASEPVVVDRDGTHEVVTIAQT